MKIVGLSAVLPLGALSAIAVLSAPAQAQVVSLPVSNGSFALQGTGAGTVYSSPLTLLSPAGTINVTATPNLPGAFYSPVPTVTVNTPIGVYITNVSGSLSLNDGRTANFTGNGTVKLEALVTVSGAASSTYRPTAAGVTVSYTVQTGSLSVPANVVSGYPDPQFTIPVTGSFSINATPTPGRDVVTINSALTPLGTINLTLADPNLGNPYFSVTTTSTSTWLSGIANGTANLNDGGTATITNRLVNLQVTAFRNNGATFLYNEQLPSVATTIQGTITGGSISVPQSAVTAPPAPVQPPAVVVQPPVSPVAAPPVAVPPVAVPPVTPPPVAAPPVTPPKKQELALGFAKSVTLRGSYEFMQQEQLDGQGSRGVDPDDLPETERSALEFSRIHPGLHGRP